MGIIKTSKLIFDYIRRDEEENIEEVNRAIDDVSIEIKEGEFVAVLGHNGSGKSTFAKQLDAILLPTDGTVWIQGLDTSKEENLWEVRKKTGWYSRIPITRLSAISSRRTWDSDRRIWGFLPTRSGNGLTRAWRRWG